MDDRPASARRRPVVVLTRLVTGGVTSLLLAGLGGLAARALMRGFALALGHEPSPVTPQGTAGIVLAFVLAVVPGTLVLALGARRLGAWLLVGGGMMVGSQSVVIGLEEGAAGLVAGPAPAFAIGLAVAFAAVVVGQQHLAWRLARPIADRAVAGLATTTRASSDPVAR